MGSRRLGRRRLHALDKQGKSLTAAEIGMGAGMSPALVSANQSREGSSITTEIQLDLGTSKASVVSTDQAIGIIGVAGLDATVADINDTNVFGHVMEVEMVCVEDVAGGNDDIILSHHTGKITGNVTGSDAAAATQSAIDDTDWNAGDNKRLALATAAHTTHRYWTLTAGDGSVNAAYTSGKIIIRYTGQANVADI